MSECGGCRGLGSHRRHCPNNPDYTYFRLLADRYEDLGDRLSNDPGRANQAYALSGLLMRLHREAIEYRHRDSGE